MSEFRFTPQAADDLLDLWSFIARDNADAADRVEAAVYRACDLLADPPLAGTERTELTRLPVSVLGCAAVFELLDCLRPETGATEDNPNSRCGPRSLCPSQTADLSPAASLTRNPIFGCVGSIVTGIPYSPSASDVTGPIDAILIFPNAASRESLEFISSATCSR
jgi:plasmid stabilization system protein ParE